MTKPFNQNCFQKICALPFFNSLNDVEKADLVKATKLQHIKLGQLLFSQGSPLTHFYVISDGIIQLFHEIEEGEQTWDILAAEDFLFDISSTFVTKVHEYSARAVINSSVLAIPCDLLHQHIKAIPLVD